MQQRAFYITILDGADKDMVVNLAAYQKNEVTFGRSSENDIVLTSTLVSKRHGRFQFNGENWVVYDDNSTNGIFWNGSKIPSKRLIGGDKLLIGYETTGNKVAFLFSDKSPQNVYHKYPLTGRNIVTIGRDIGRTVFTWKGPAPTRRCSITVWICRHSAGWLTWTDS